MEIVDVFTAKQADQWCRRIQNMERTQGRTFSGYHTHIRNSSVIWYEPDTARTRQNNRISERDSIWKVGERAGIEFDWISTPWQFAVYNPGEYYDWHTDHFEVRKSSQRTHTLVVELQSAPSAGIEFDNTGPVDLKPGQGILFDSTVPHRALPPLEGTRISLTVWFMRRAWAQVE